VSEGPEVRRTADRLAEALVGARVERVELRRRVPLDPRILAKLDGARVRAVRTFGKHLVIAFSGGVWLHNHMMMWGKWRVYPRAAFDRGAAKPPPRVQWRRPDADRGRVGATVSDVRDDSRVRLILATKDRVAVQFNGPLLQFGTKDPARAHASIVRLGPDGLAPRFAVAAARKRLRERASKTLADLLLDQCFVAGVGNKYKSEILFVQKLYPFQRAGDLDPGAEKAFLAEIPRTLRYGYVHGGRTRPLGEGEAGNRWAYKHWVFRRGGRPCWVCDTRILADRRSSARVTFFCPSCQPLPVAPEDAIVEAATVAAPTRQRRRV
jgi:endonuclease-8